jgi:hypothetical protein
VDKFVTSGMIVAVDAGDYCTGTIQEIGSRMAGGQLQGVRIIATCDAAASEAAFVGVPQAMSADTSKVIRPVYCPSSSCCSRDCHLGWGAARELTFSLSGRQGSLSASRAAIETEVHDGVPCERVRLMQLLLEALAAGYYCRCLAHAGTPPV